MRKYIAALICAVSFGSPAFAAATRSGTINELFVRASDGITWITMNGTVTGTKPACATQNYMMIKDENSTAGKNQIAMLMSAYLSKTPIVVEGAGTCTRWTDGEDIQSVVFK